MSELKVFSSLTEMNDCLVECRLCPRLVHYRETVPLRKALQDLPTWRRPVPGFGDRKAWLLITGLAPSIEGGNRTGRIFTGDKSAKFLIKALYDAGFANQPTSETRDDGLKMKGCYLTASVKCVPPDNRPTKKEFTTCTQNYYWNELHLLKNVTTILALGKLAFDAYLHFLHAQGIQTRGLTFKHGARYELENGMILAATYHPSPQNTNTGKMTESMFLKVLKNL